MTDIEITKDATGEFMVAQLEGMSETGTEFIDAWSEAEMHVVDSGRIVIPEESLDHFLTCARQAGLEIA